MQNRPFLSLFGSHVQDPHLSVGTLDARPQRPRLAHVSLISVRRQRTGERGALDLLCHLQACKPGWMHDPPPPWATVGAPGLGPGGAQFDAGGGYGYGQQSGAQAHRGSVAAQQPELQAAAGSGPRTSGVPSASLPAAGGASRAGLATATTGGVRVQCLATATT
jgi:hypothetical protein